MKSVQFLHIETYKQKSEKKSMRNNSDTRESHFRGVLNEARRKPGYCNHVAEPEAPLVLYGVSVNEVESLTEDYINNFRMKNEKGVERKIRKDSAVLLAGVVSLDREEMEMWDNYKKDAIKFLKEKYGDRLKSVIEHTDEAHPHFHFYVVANSDELVNDLHDGKRATAEMVKYNRKNKNNKQSQQLAYREAMTKFQDDFYFAVAQKYGLDRTGLKPRTRLSRGDYKKQEKERLAAKNLLNNLNIEVKKAENYVKNEKLIAENESKIIKNKAKKEGYNLAIKDFKNKNYLQKLIFLLDFQKKKIIEMENKNKDLTKKCKLILKRKDLYKIKYNKNKDFEDKYNNLKTDFSKRVAATVQLKNDENVKLTHFNKKQKLEIEELKEENEYLKKENEKLNFAQDLLNKLKRKLGLSHFKSLIDEENHKNNNQRKNRF